MFKPGAVTLGVLVLAGALALPARGEHEGDLWIGVSSVGQLKLSPAGFEPDESWAAVVVLSPGGGLFPGWTGNNPGFDDVETDSPVIDTYTLEVGANIWLDVVALDEALYVWNAQLQHFGPGQMAHLGSAPADIHTHLIWHIYSLDPSFDALCVHWNGAFRLVDTGGTGYAASEPFTMVFSNVECRLGDIDASGQVDYADIDPFVAVLSDAAGATAEQRCAADADLDGYVGYGDIDAFVALIGG